MTGTPVTKKEALERIERALAEIEKLRGGRRDTAEHVSFVQTTGLDLARIFGPDSPVTKNFSSIDYNFSGRFITSMLNYEQELQRRRRIGYERGLDIAKGILRSAREQLQTYGADDILRSTRVRSEGARVFISHGGEELALGKLERFIRALGLHPVIVMREPSEGLALDDLVEKRMSECDCVIILATADEEVGERLQPRPNVIHEIGLAQEIHGDRIIYLKEEACEFPSNVRPKVWGDFNRDGMEAAFEKLVKELRSFGFI